MSDEKKEPHADLVTYLRDNTIFARHSRHEVRAFIDRLMEDGYRIVGQLPKAPKIG